MYNVRYFEQNEHGRAGPWSLRHMGVYENLHLETLQRTWLLVSVQPSTRIMSCVEKYLASPDRKKELHSARSLYLHATILFKSSRNWLDYIDYTRSSLDKLVGSPITACVSCQDQQK